MNTEVPRGDTLGYLFPHLGEVDRMNFEMKTAHSPEHGPFVSMRITGDDGQQVTLGVPPHIAANIADMMHLQTSLCIVFSLLKEFLISDMELHPKRADEMVERFTNQVIQEVMKGEKDGS